MMFEIHKIYNGRTDYRVICVLTSVIEGQDIFLVVFNMIWHSGMKIFTIKYPNCSYVDFGVGLLEWLFILYSGMVLLQDLK